MKRKFCKHYMQNRCSQAEMATTESSIAKIYRDVLREEDDDERKLVAMAGGIIKDPDYEIPEHAWPDVDESNKDEESSDSTSGNTTSGDSSASSGSAQGS